MSDGKQRVTPWVLLWYVVCYLVLLGFILLICIGHDPVLALSLAKVILPVGILLILPVPFVNRVVSPAVPGVFIIWAMLIMIMVLIAVREILASA